MKTLIAALALVATAVPAQAVEPTQRFDNDKPLSLATAEADCQRLTLPSAPFSSCVVAPTDDGSTLCILATLKSQSGFTAFCHPKK